MIKLEHSPEELTTRIIDILSPVGFVLVTVFAFNALGDGLRDAIDPY